MDKRFIECTIYYVGMDTLEHEQEFSGTQNQLDGELTYLEEHGAHCISTDLEE